jgi:hypothetical protein
MDEILTFPWRYSPVTLSTIVGVFDFIRTGVRPQRVIVPPGGHNNPRSHQAEREADADSFSQAEFRGSRQSGGLQLTAFVDVEEQPGPAGLTNSEQSIWEGEVGLMELERMVAIGAEGRQGTSRPIALGMPTFRA